MLKQMKGTQEPIKRRAFPVVDLRVEGEGAQHIRGHAAVFDTDSVPLFEWGGERLVERIAPGAFTKTLQEADIRALWNHNPDLVLGRNKADTLFLEEDERGLAVDISPPDTQWGRDAVTTIRRGDVSQMSFAFKIIKDRVEREMDPDSGVVTYRRTLLEVRLYEVSPVTFPAYPDTDVGVRAAMDVVRRCIPQAPESGEPGQGSHSSGASGGHRSGGEPGQAAHSAAARDRYLALIEKTL